MGNNLFTVLTTLLSILIAIVTCISAIYIAYKQRKIGKQAHLNNLSVETPEEENSAKELLNSVIHLKALPVQRHGCLNL